MFSVYCLLFVVITFISVQSIDANIISLSPSPNDEYTYMSFYNDYSELWTPFIQMKYFSSIISTMNINDITQLSILLSNQTSNLYIPNSLNFNNYNFKIKLNKNSLSKYDERTCDIIHINLETNIVSYELNIIKNKCDYLTYENNQYIKSNKLDKILDNINFKRRRLSGVQERSLIIAVAVLAVVACLCLCGIGLGWFFFLKWQESLKATVTDLRRSTAHSEAGIPNNGGRKSFLEFVKSDVNGRRTSKLEAKTLNIMAKGPQLAPLQPNTGRRVSLMNKPKAAFSGFNGNNNGFPIYEEGNQLEGGEGNDLEGGKNNIEMQKVKQNERNQKDQNFGNMLKDLQMGNEMMIDDVVEDIDNRDDDDSVVDDMRTPGNDDDDDIGQTNQGDFGEN